MLARDTRDPVLARFLRELDEQSPLSLDGVTPPRVASFGQEELEAARYAWAARVVDEYRSVVVFSELLRLLGEAAAPFPTLCAVQRVIGDELRHAELCARVASWLGADGRVEVDLEGLGLPPSDRAPVERAYEIVVRELVNAERESLLVLAAYRDATSDPAVKRAFQILVVDEARHYVAGRSIARALEARFPSLATLAVELEPVIAGDLDHMRTIYAGAAARGGVGRALGASITTDDLLRRAVLAA